MTTPAPPDLAALCTAYGIEAQGEPQAASPRVWRLRTSAGELAIKRHGADRQAQAANEAAILAHLQAHPDPRFRVQALCLTTDGEPLWMGPHGPALVTRWVTGTSRTYDTFTHAEWQALGTSLAALHARLDGLALVPVDSLHARLQGLDDDALRRGLRQDLCRASRLGRAAALRPYVKTCLRLLDVHYPGAMAAFPSEDPQALIHHDYNQFNLLFGTSLPPTVLDWEAAIRAPRVYELVRCLNHLPLEHPERARHFVQAYVRARPVPVSQLAWAVDAACLQQVLKRWVRQGWLEDPARHAAHLEGAMRMASMMAGRRDELIAFFEHAVGEALP